MAITMPIVCKTTTFPVLLLRMHATGNPHRWIAVWMGVFWGCQSPPPSTYFRIGVFSPFTSLDPAYARDQLSVWLTQQIFEGLVALDESLRVVPSLAYRWEVLPQGYRFYLRRGVRFHDGDTLKAQHVLISWQRILDPKTASPGRYIFLAHLDGAQEYAEGKTPSLRGVKVLSDSVLEVELRAPFTPFLQLLTLPYAFVVSPKALKLGKAFAQKPIGTGPFSFLHHEENRSLHLRRFDAYWGKKTFLPGISFLWYDNRLWAWEDLRRNRLEAFEGTDYTLQVLLRNPPPSCQILSTPQLGIEYLGLDCRAGGIFENVGLRRWIYQNLHSDSLVSQILPGQAVAAWSFAPPELLDRPVKWSVPTAPPPDLPTRPVRFLAHPQFRWVAQYIQKKLGQAGLAVELEYTLGPSLREQIAKGTADMWKASWLADYPDATNFHELFLCSQKAPKGPNTTHFCDPRVDSLYAYSLRAPDSLRRKLANHIEHQLNYFVPIIPLYRSQGIWTLRKEVENFPCNALPTWLPLHQVKLKKPTT
ncbi:MAG: ABC transporter substrate-binding protein [Bacteroidia bacterium]